MIRVGLRVRIDVTITKVGEPLRNVAGFMVLEELMDAASAQSGRRGNVADRESGIMGRNDGPDTFAFGFLSSRGGQLEPSFKFSFMLDKLVDFFTGSSHGQRIPGCASGVR